MYEGMQNAGFSFTREYPYQAGCSLVGGTPSGTGPNKICVGATTCPAPSTNPNVPYTYVSADQLCERPSQCLPPNVINPNSGRCEPPESYTIQLDLKSATIEPTGTAAQNVKTSQAFTATVTGDKNGAKAGAEVTIKAEVEAHSGGHPHDDANRPKGILGNSTVHTLCNPNASQPQACITGTTDTNGQFTFTFNSTEVSGKHTVTATCDVCRGNQDQAIINVKVEGLVSLSASSTDYVLVGGTTTHSVITT